MTDDQKLLCEISKTAHTGLTALDAVTPNVKHPSIKNALDEQKQHFKKFEQQARRALRENGVPDETGGMMNQLNKINIRVQSKINHTPERISNMIIQGNNMGIISLQRARNHYPNASYQSKHLADQMLHFEQQTIDAYKKYL